MKCKLHSLELFVYFSVWTLANLYSLYKLYQAQSGILDHYQDIQYYLKDLEPGWSYVSRLKDISDIEWSSWKYFIHTSWPYLVLQFIGNEIVRRKSICQLKHWYIISSVLYILFQMGLKQLIIIFAQLLLYAGVVLLGGQKFCIWVTSILLLVSYNSLKYKFFFWNFLERDNLYDEEVYLILFCVAWVELRCISFSIDYVEKKQKYNHSPPVSETITNMLSYVLYVPLLYTGPIILYEEFEKSFTAKTERLSVKLKRFLFDISLFLIYSTILDLSLHYIYFYAMQNDMNTIKALPTIALCGGGLWMGLQFHMKYVIAYGTTSAFARLDNFDPPPTPRCIARIHVYSQMWRYFDVGLYRFLVKYVYKPNYYVVSKYIKSSKSTCKLLASLSTFFFIFIWHGTIKRIFVWSILNYLGITLEYVSKAISESERYKWFKRRVLRTDAMETRFIGFLCVPLLALSAISNFYLFAGTDVGDLFFKTLYGPSLLNSLIICFSLYCCCQVSMSLEDVPSRTDAKTKQISVK